MSGDKVVAWRWRDRATLQYVHSADEPRYSNKEPLVLQSDLAAAIARADAAEARGVMLTMGLRAAVTALAHASESDAIYTRTYEHASHALRDYAIDRAEIAAQQEVSNG